MERGHALGERGSTVLQCQDAAVKLIDAGIQICCAFFERCRTAVQLVGAVLCGIDTAGVIRKPGIELVVAVKLSLESDYALASGCGFFHGCVHLRPDLIRLHILLYEKLRLLVGLCLYRGADLGRLHRGLGFCLYRALHGIALHPLIYCGGDRFLLRLAYHACGNAGFILFAGHSHRRKHLCFDLGAYRRRHLCRDFLFDCGCYRIAYLTAFGFDGCGDLFACRAFGKRLYVFLGKRGNNAVKHIAVIFYRQRWDLKPRVGKLFVCRGKKGIEHAACAVIECAAVIRELSESVGKLGGTCRKRAGSALEGCSAVFELFGSGCELVDARDQLAGFFKQCA